MFRVDMTVRDYECDIQGVVNNAVYQNYLEHSRHQFLLAKNIDFVALAQEGIHLMLVRAELDYLSSLKPGDAFYITVTMEKESRLKFVFHQTLYRLSDDKKMVAAKAYGVAVGSNGRPIRLASLDALGLEDGVSEG